MRRFLTLLGITVAGLAIVGFTGAVLLRPVLADDAKPAAAATTTTAASPIVAAFPYRYDTEYEPDPFETTRLRRARTEVSHVLLVHADGTQEIKSAK